MAVSAANLKARYEAFSTLTDARVELSLIDARRQVDDSWLEDDRDRAITLYACHLLIAEGALDGGSSSVETRQIQSEKLGDAQVTYYIPSGGDVQTQAGGLDSTIYGKQFQQLLRQNQWGPVVAK